MDTKIEITVPVQVSVADVTAWPDEVQIEVHAREGNLTPAEARQVADALLQSAALAEKLDWSGDEEPQLIWRAS